jgi:hypothetical protein
MSLNLGLRRDIKWRFFVADVSKPILGADFLAQYNFLPDLSNGPLLDSTTLLTSNGEVTAGIPSIKSVAGSPTYHQLLQQFPRVTRPNGSTEKTQHDTVPT